MHVLLVGGHPPLVRALQQGLEEELYTVDVVYVGQDEARRIPVGDYDAIVLDLARPETVGRNFLTRCRLARSLTPILVLTPHRLYDDDDPWPRGVDWLIKPFDLDEFFDWVRATALRERFIGTTELRPVPG